MLKGYNGDLLSSGCDIICHQVNCQGKMGSGIAKQIRERYGHVYLAYIDFCSNKKGELLLGSIKPVCIESNVDGCAYEGIANRRFIVNVFSQDKYGYNGKQYTDYNAFKLACNRIRAKFDNDGNRPIRIGFPDHIGCGLGGGDWSVMRKIIEDIFVDDNKWSVEIWKYNL